MTFTIIIPAFNEAENIKMLYQKLNGIFNVNYTVYYLFIDDGSTDSTLQILKQLKEEDPKIHYISLSRNFGHQNAIKAGLDYAKGDFIVMMDADLQHPPEVIEMLIEKWEEGWDVVNTIRKGNIRQGFFKRKTSALFYKIINKLSDVPIQSGAADFRLMDRKVVDAIRQFGENHLFLRGLIRWAGFRQTWIEFEVAERKNGKSKYSLIKMIRLALCGITSFSITPLRAAMVLGLVCAGFSFLYGIYAIYIVLFTTKAVSGWASILAGMMFLSGLQFLLIGIIGEYLGKLFIENKRRPNYIVREST